ncbi:MAG TPA: glycosyltransferase family 9 protein [Desulfuromonadales bacterium]|nr:glycosyltransferase family 9 protein [Desulfuromonadales bacterium]
MNIRLVKLIDRLLGTAVVTLLPSPAAPAGTVAGASLLIIRPGGIGDAVMLAPLIRTIRAAHPEITITILAESRNSGVFPLIPGVERVLRYDRPSEFAEALAGRYDAVIDCEQWHRMSAIVARLVKAPLKIGFGTNQRLRMFTHALPYSQDDYEAVSFLRLALPLGLPDPAVTVSTPFLTIPAAAAEKAARLTERLNGRQYIVMFPGASIEERKWGAERFRAVAEKLSECSFATVVVGGIEERNDGERISEKTGLNLAGATTLAETAALIGRSRLLISGDSGVLHLAAGLDIPTVSLFGPGIAAKWAPHGAHHAVIDHRLPCSPCTRFGTTPPCPRAVRCMTEITPDEVADAALKLLTSGGL